MRALLRTMTRTGRSAGTATRYATRQARQAMRHERWMARQATRASRGPFFSGATRDAWGRAGAGALRAGAYGGAAVGGLWALGEYGGDFVTSIKDDPTDYSLQENIKETPAGTWFVGPDGDSHFMPTMDYLDMMNRAQAGGSPIDGAPLTPYTLDEGDTEGMKGFKEVLDNLTDPVTLVIVGGVIAGIVYVRGKSKSGGGGKK